MRTVIYTDIARDGAPGRHQSGRLPHACRGIARAGGHRLRRRVSSETEIAALARHGRRTAAILGKALYAGQLRSGTARWRIAGGEAQHADKAHHPLPGRAGRPGGQGRELRGPAGRGTTRWNWPASTTSPARTSWCFTTSPPAPRAGGCLPTCCARVAAEIFIPLTVGGGINTLEDFDRVLKCGADKVSVNSGAIRRSRRSSRAAAKRYGDQCVVLSMDVKRVDGALPRLCQAAAGRTPASTRWTGSARGVAQRRGRDRGQLHRHRRGARAALTWRCWTPLGGAGGRAHHRLRRRRAACEDFADAVPGLPRVDAGLAASIFHSREVDIRALKRCLRASGVEVRHA